MNHLLYMIYVNLIIIFLFIIFIHELGHYTVARIFKTTVTDFSIGFGKVLFQFKDKYLTTWKISLIPLGGYVKIKGLESIFNNSVNIDQNLDSFHNLNLIKKISILIAGSAFNIISAWLCLFFIFFFFGIVNFSSVIGGIVKDSPAELNGIQEGDIVVRINDKNIEYFSDIAFAINNSQKIKIDIVGDNKLITKEFNLSYKQEIGKYFIGIQSTNTPEIKKYSLFDSFKQSTFFIPTYYLESFKYLTRSYKNNTLSQEIAGPIGIVKMADKLMLDKIKGVLFIFISISLFVGLFNLFPIPLLDGGHIIYFIIRSIFSDALPSFITRVYLLTGITIISFLFIIITFNDIFYK